jgi:hypothetical protein
VTDGNYDADFHVAHDIDPPSDELKTLAVELQDLLQSKVGTTKFANAYSRIRQSVLSVRRDRRTARVMQVRISQCLYLYADIEVDHRQLQTQRPLRNGSYREIL